MTIRVASSGAKWSAAMQQLRERPPTHELHPDADRIADLLGAVDRDDVVVPNAGEQPPFMDDVGRCRCGTLRRGSASARLHDPAARPTPGTRLQTCPGRCARGSAGDPQAAGTRWMLATAATTCSCSTSGRSRRIHETIRRPPVDRGAIEDVGRNRLEALVIPATLHLLCQTNQRPLRGLPRRIGAGLVERLGELLVGVAELDAADDRVLFFRPQPLERSS